MKEVGLKYEDLTNLACTVGPGGFTSLRIGITAVNTLAYALGIPSAGIHLSDLWLARAQTQDTRHKTQENPSQMFWLHSTRKTQLFVKDFDSDEIKLLTLDEVKNLKCSYVGELIEDHKQALPNCTPVPNDQVMTLEEVLPSFLADLNYDADQLQPWYGRNA
jgi:tRNA A37 threonylcarbamoyladenosine modification protein TsaB